MSKNKSHIASDKRKEQINLKPRNSMIQKSILTETIYHVIKFYTRINPIKAGTFEHVGYEAVDQHKIGNCQFCKVLVE